MASSELRRRANWQTISGAKALKTEERFQVVLQAALDSVYPGEFVVDRHPTEFSDIYSKYPLNEDTMNKIYNIDINEQTASGKPKYSWGISMDFAIRNIVSGKILFGESL